MGLLQAQGSQDGRGGACYSQHLHSSGAEKLFAALGSWLWAVDGRPVAGFLLARRRLSPGPSCPGEMGVGGGRGPSQGLCSQERHSSSAPRPQRLVASVAVTSWPQLTPPGVVLFLNIGSGC